MKRSIVIILLLSITISRLVAQTPTNIIQNTGNVGIGTLTPLEGLWASPGIEVKGSRGTLGLTTNTVGGIATLRFAGPSSEMHLNYLTSASGDALALYKNPTGYMFVVKGNGYIGIGTEEPDSKLSVNGTIHSKEVKVDLTGWPDYVFDKNYTLKPLLELERFIQRHHHLPEMPTAAEVEKEGLKLGAMNSKLLQKIEELTLYLIELNKTVIQQQLKIEKLESNK